MAKARHASEVTRFADIPNVGPATIGDFEDLGIESPQQLAGLDPYRLYRQLQGLQGERLDPCVCDVLLAAVRFMQGAPAQPWWHYTAERKAHLSASRPSAG